jgi:hypothetical protein
LKSPYHGINHHVFKIPSQSANGIVLCNSRALTFFWQILCGLYQHTPPPLLKKLFISKPKNYDRDCSSLISAPTHGTVSTLEPAVNASSAVAPLVGVPTACVTNNSKGDPNCQFYYSCGCARSSCPDEWSFGTLECPERFTFGKYWYCNVHDDDSFEFRLYCSKSLEIWGIGTAMMSNSQNAKQNPPIVNLYRYATKPFFD